MGFTLWTGPNQSLVAAWLAGQSPGIEVVTKAVRVEGNGRCLEWMGFLVSALTSILMPGPVPSVDSGFSSAPHGPYRRSGAA